VPPRLVARRAQAGVRGHPRGGAPVDDEQAPDPVQGRRLPRSQGRGVGGRVAPGRLLLLQRLLLRPARRALLFRERAPEAAARQVLLALGLLGRVRQVLRGGGGGARRPWAGCLQHGASTAHARSPSVPAAADPTAWSAARRASWPWARPAPRRRGEQAAPEDAVRPCPAARGCWRAGCHRRQSSEAW
jgi:hypothetical protein